MSLDWTSMLAAAADPERARGQWKRLNGSPLASTWLNSIGRESAEALISVLGGSTYFGDLIIQHPDWLASTLSPETLRHGRRSEGIQREVAAFLDALLAVADHPRALRQLRLFKQREHLRIVARDIGRFAPLEVITRELTDLAEICLAGVLRVARAQLGARFGEPWHQTGEQWRSTNFALIGLGNLGGMELDHSTSLDLVFLYEEEGFVFRRPPKAGAPTPVSGFSNREFFLRLSEMLVAEMELGTEEGLLYRLGRRFGPEDPSGALAFSLPAFEAYFNCSGQFTDRMMLLKSRMVAGDRSLAEEFIECIQPFRYPRSLIPAHFREIVSLKQRMQARLTADEAAWDLDGRIVGILEIEFIVQVLQSVNGGREPFLQGGHTLAALQKLREYGHLNVDQWRQLSDAYLWLREVEHRLQFESDRPTRSLPTMPLERTHLARLMGCNSWDEFFSLLSQHKDRVRAVFDNVLKSPLPD